MGRGAAPGPPRQHRGQARGLLHRGGAVGPRSPRGGGRGGRGGAARDSVQRVRRRRGQGGRAVQQEEPR
eukprot:3658320-Lingulodinium_polyedra.AAC.1